MLNSLVSFMLASSLSLSGIVVDPRRLAAETASDQDVLLSLREQGDISSTSRRVDLRFKGNRSNLEKLKPLLVDSGWSTEQLVEIQSPEFALDVYRDQTTDARAILELTTFALKAEIAANVQYDG